MDELDRALKVVAESDQREVLRRGWHLVKRHYYTPLNDPEWLEANRDLWQGPHVPRDIDWNVEGQLAVAREVSRYVEELRDVPEVEADRTGPAAFHWDNNFFNATDALVWYGLVRSRRPPRVVEVGSGWSSMLLARALARNAQEGSGAVTHVTQIEPHPNERVFAALPREWARHRVPVQRAPLGVFDELRAGDVLFYDGSHCARVGSDVNWMVFRVLPRLRAGVLVHFHDLFWPLDYPRSWIFGRGQTWNEQYVVQALLMNSRAYRVVIANRMLADVRGPEVVALYRGVQPAWGASVWIEKVAEPDAKLEAEAARLEEACVKQMEERAAAKARG